jgi:hypothetical protein
MGGEWDEIGWRGAAVRVLFQSAEGLTHSHRPCIVMVGEGAPSTPLVPREEGVDADLRRHDGAHARRVGLIADWYYINARTV